MTKDEAFGAAIRRWRALPPANRQTQEQAQVFAAGLTEELDFRTMGNARKVIAAWLIRDLALTSIGPTRPAPGELIGPRPEAPAG